MGLKTRKLFWPLMGIVTFILIVGWWWYSGPWGAKAREAGEKAWQTLRGKSNIKVTSQTKGIENYRKLKPGCPMKDCIPALVQPKFETKLQADEWLKNEELVLGLDLKGEQKAYPVKILNWHEVVNDKIQDLPIAITWCTLSGAAKVFKRQIEGQTLTFGISGRVYNSNVVMYDRQTETFWQQMTGEGIVGKLFGSKLEQIPVDTLTWEEWKTAHPNTKVLSIKTGYSRSYDEHPYGTYETDSAIYFPVEGGVNEEMPAKTVIYGIEIGGEFKAYSLSAIDRETEYDSVLPDNFSGKRIRISYNKGKIFVEDLQNKGEIVPTRAYWFVWRAFYPKTELYQ